jgi:hypothetical protein
MVLGSKLGVFGLNFTVEIIGCSLSRMTSWISTFRIDSVHMSCHLNVRIAALKYTLIHVLPSSWRHKNIRS